MTTLDSDRKRQNNEYQTLLQFCLKLLETPNPTPKKQISRKKNLKEKPKKAKTVEEKQREEKLEKEREDLKPYVDKISKLIGTDVFKMAQDYINPPQKKDESSSEEDNNPSKKENGLLRQDFKYILSLFVEQDFKKDKESEFIKELRKVHNEKSDKIIQKIFKDAYQTDERRSLSITETNFIKRFSCEKQGRKLYFIDFLKKNVAVSGDGLRLSHVRQFIARNYHNLDKQELTGGISNEMEKQNKIWEHINKQKKEAGNIIRRALMDPYYKNENIEGDVLLAIRDMLDPVVFDGIIEKYNLPIKNKKINLHDLRVLLVVISQKKSEYLQSFNYRVLRSLVPDESQATWSECLGGFFRSIFYLVTSNKHVQERILRNKKLQRTLIIKVINFINSNKTNDDLTNLKNEILNSFKHHVSIKNWNKFLGDFFGSVLSMVTSHKEIQEKTANTYDLKRIIENCMISVESNFYRIKKMNEASIHQSLKSLRECLLGKNVTKDKIYEHLSYLSIKEELKEKITECIENFIEDTGDDQFTEQDCQTLNQNIQIKVQEYFQPINKRKEEHIKKDVDNKKQQIKQLKSSLLKQISGLLKESSNISKKHIDVDKIITKDNIQFLLKSCLEIPKEFNNEKAIKAFQTVLERNIGHNFRDVYKYAVRAVVRSLDVYKTNDSIYEKYKALQKSAMYEQVGQAFAYKDFRGGERMCIITETGEQEAVRGHNVIKMKALKATAFVSECRPPDKPVRVMLAFRGTHNPSSGLADADPGGAGFEHIQKNILSILKRLNKIIETIKKEGSNSIELHVTGHSLGGAYTQAFLVELLKVIARKDNVQAKTLDQMIKKSLDYKPIPKEQLPPEIDPEEVHSIVSDEIKKQLKIIKESDLNELSCLNTNNIKAIHVGIKSSANIRARSSITADVLDRMRLFASDEDRDNYCPIERSTTIISVKGDIVPYCGERTVNQSSHPAECYVQYLSIDNNYEGTRAILSRAINGEIAPLKAHCDRFYNDPDGDQMLDTKGHKVTIFSNATEEEQKKLYKALSYKILGMFSKRAKSALRGIKEVIHRLTFDPRQDQLKSVEKERRGPKYVRSGLETLK